MKLAQDHVTTDLTLAPDYLNEYFIHIRILLFIESNTKMKHLRIIKRILVNIVYCLIHLIDVVSNLKRIKSAGASVRIHEGFVQAFKVRADFNLFRIRSQTNARLRSILQDLVVEAWEITSSSNLSTQLGILSDHRDIVVDALKRRADLAYWYWQELSESGRPMGPPRLFSKLRSGKKYAAIQVFEIVSIDRFSSFQADDSQGVILTFWDHDSSSDRLVAKAWNERITEVENLATRRKDFSQSLFSANAHRITDVDFPIDVVYTWVDGSDHKWQKLKVDALSLDDPENFIQNAIDEARFKDHDELKFSLRSIEQFAPWINHIWLVTAGQVPNWLNVGNDKITIVDHKDIWKTDDGLPNFNSHAIEANINNIENLSKYFLYFNDDFILGRPVKPETFFHGNGVTKFFESKTLVNYINVQPIDNASTIAAKNARSVIFERFGRSFSRKFYHTPSAIDRSVLTLMEAENEELFDLTRRAKFRQNSDIAAVGSFYFNWANAMGRAVPGRISYAYIDPSTFMGRKLLSQVIKKRNYDTLCINDGSTNETDRQREESDLFIKSSLQKLLPIKSSFEK